MEPTQVEQVRRLVTVDTAVKITSLSKSAIYRLMESGQLEYLHFGRSRRIPADALARFIDSKIVRSRTSDPAALAVA